MPAPRRPLHPDPTESVNFTHPSTDKIPEVKKKKPPKKKKHQWEKDPLRVAAGRRSWENQLKKSLKQAFFTDSRDSE